MANQTPTQNFNAQYHAYWGVYTAFSDLPNRPGNVIVSPGDFDVLQQGDVAYVSNDSLRYLCTDPGTSGGGDATWVALSTAAADDHQTAKIIVGNDPAGDSALVCDFLDPGDGSGIAAALASGPGDVYVRPGTYDFGLPGSPALPLTIDANRALRGPNIGAPAAVGGDPTQAPLLRTNPDDRRLFEFDHAARIEKIGIEIVPPNVGATGTTLIDGTFGLANAPRFLEDVLIVLPDSGVANESLTALVRSQNRIDVVRCFVITQNGNYRTGSLIAYDGPEYNIEESEISGVDVGVRFQTTAGTIKGLVCGDVDIGVDVTSGANSTRIDMLLCAADSIGMRVDARFVIADNISLFPITEGVGTGLLATTNGQLLQVTRMRVDGWSIAADVAGVETNFGDCWIEGVDRGAVIRAAAIETQLSNCNVRQNTGNLSGVGVEIEPSADRCVLTNIFSKGWDTGIDIGADDCIVVAGNYASNTTPVVETGTGTEKGHNII